MTREEFLEKFVDQFLDTDPSEIQFETRFRDLEEWSSLMGLSIMAMANDEWNVLLSGSEIRNANTVEDIYNLVASKL